MYNAILDEFEDDATRTRVSDRPFDESVVASEEPAREDDEPDDPNAIFIYPGAEELCDDFLDNDCDGLFNDGCENRGKYASLEGGSLCGLSPRGSNKSAVLLLLTLIAVVVRARGERSC